RSNWACSLFHALCSSAWLCALLPAATAHERYGVGCRRRGVAILGAASSGADDDCIARGEGPATKMHQCRGRRPLKGYPKCPSAVSLGDVTLVHGPWLLPLRQPLRA